MLVLIWLLRNSLGEMALEITLYFISIGRFPRFLYLQLCSVWVFKLTKTQQPSSSEYILFSSSCYFRLVFFSVWQSHQSSAWHQIILQLIEDRETDTSRRRPTCRERERGRKKARERKCLVWFGHIVIEINRKLCEWAQLHEMCFQAENLTQHRNSFII